MICFDESLPVFVRTLADALGARRLKDGVALRDVSGRLAFFCADELHEAEHAAVVSSLRQRVGSYAREDRVLCDIHSPGAESVLGDPNAGLFMVGDSWIRFLDRRVVGADWTSDAEAETAVPPRIVFASLKGGVGRSTALSILAAEQARRGKNVLVFDLDLEAPGVGAMLLRERRPRFGAVDYLVETGLHSLSDDDLTDFVETSDLTNGGVVDVVPAVGSMTASHPGNFLSKLSRALSEDVTSEGETVPLREKLRRMLRRFESRRTYDLVLVDARSGLSELTAGPLLWLGATVLLFGTAQSHTVEGYRYLLAHLRDVAQSGSNRAWRERIHMVHAKAPANTEELELFRGEIWELFLEYLYEESVDLGAFSFAADDPDAPHYAIPILMDSRFADWDPVRRRSDLQSPFYESTFGPFLEAIEAMISVPASVREAT
jgi:cellulose biosynthesis protein BcsQ